MDTNFLLTTILLIVFLIVVICFDDGFLLFFMGFLSIAIAINMDVLLSIGDSSYQGFGQLIRLMWAFIGVFSFASIFWSAPMFERVRARFRRHG